MSEGSEAAWDPFDPSEEEEDDPIRGDRWSAIGSGQRRHRLLTDSQEYELASIFRVKCHSTCAMTVAEACQLAREKYPLIQAKFSASWLHDFMKTHHLSLRERRPYERWTVDPMTMREAGIAFLRDLRETCRQQYLKTGNDFMTIINVDESSHQPNPKAPKGIAPVGARVVRGAVRNAKTPATFVMMAVATGTLAPSMVIFQGEKDLEVKRPTADSNTLIHFAKKKWMSGELWLQVIDFIYRSQQPPILLIADSASMHTTPEAYALCEKYGIVYKIIPEGMTPFLQPCDVGLMAPFKQRLKGTFLKAKTAEMDMSDRRTHLIRSVEETVQWLNAHHGIGLSAFLKSGVLSACSIVRGRFDYNVKIDVFGEVIDTATDLPPLPTSLADPSLDRTVHAASSSSAAASAAAGSTVTGGTAASTAVAATAAAAMAVNNPPIRKPEKPKKSKETTANLNNQSCFKWADAQAVSQPARTVAAFERPMDPPPKRGKKSSAAARGEPSRNSSAVTSQPAVPSAIVSPPLAAPPPQAPPRPPVPPPPPPPPHPSASSASQQPPSASAVVSTPPVRAAQSRQYERVTASNTLPPLAPPVASSRPTRKRKPTSVSDGYVTLVPTEIIDHLLD